ncbi:beta-N-acetylhexosaminidase [Aquimarina sp. 2201CG5-10]|uniref:beta-N-acetylhexosaminidase n=1 Tax=Aquimarina callyspongiae TaxID=3098150 RepID=UPI002AB3CEE1|nr:family 20 glycosylhydrolase [Aquimarina sp. 2201CG5-10]MDY8134518.1 family 20 glycosylhydrolase [Aquimarina sp. 2201CG5-10]
MKTIFYNNALKVCCLTLMIFALGCNKEKTLVASQPMVIPAPLHQEVEQTVFKLNDKTGLEFDQDFKESAKILNNYLEKGLNTRLESNNKAKNAIFLEKDMSIIHDEGYRLFISNDSIKVQSKTNKGAFYAVQTLRQLLPICFENGSCSEKEFALQGVTILDAPQYVYRGMHLDVGRHFFKIEEIKKYLDMLALLKMNTFHWHLTEDQGWRIEIKKYPRLTEIGGYRDETLVGHYGSQPHKYDGKRYGGFYTQEEIKEIVTYAEERNITVIPEIEMPGHSQAAIAAYPELGCSGKEVKVATKWGIFEEVYCPNQKTFAFLEGVLDEVIELFPSTYIHIGGDEAPKTRWKSCNHCQKLIKDEGLKDEHELQSYFITRIEKYLNSKGRRIIGWDEILEGGLAPDATVMSWRGTNGAVQAAKEKHDVILTPTSHCYFDHYQSNNENEPLAIGGFLPLEKVYSFNPIPEELTPEEAKYVLGAQGNVWTEYIPTYDKVEYMAFPRAIALSEVVWSPANKKDYKSFLHRLENLQKRLDILNVNYANHLYEVSGNLERANNQLKYTLTTQMNDKSIRYTTDGSEPDSTSVLYENPILINKDVVIKASLFNDQKPLGGIFIQEFDYHKGIEAQITINKEPHKSYGTGGKEVIINGVSAKDTRFKDKEWLGFWGEDLEIAIDLGKEKEIQSISTRFYEAEGHWIYRPESVKITLLDQEKNELLGGGSMQLFLKDKELTSTIKMESNGEKVRYIKIEVKKYGQIPEGSQGAGNQAWTFIDEVVIE